MWQARQESAQAGWVDFAFRETLECIAMAKEEIYNVDSNKKKKKTRKEKKNISCKRVFGFWYFSLEIQRSFAYRCDNYNKLNHVEYDFFSFVDGRPSQRNFILATTPNSLHIIHIYIYTYTFHWTSSLGNRRKKSNNIDYN